MAVYVGDDVPDTPPGCRTNLVGQVAVAVAHLFDQQALGLFVLRLQRDQQLVHVEDYGADHEEIR